MPETRANLRGELSPPMVLALGYAPARCRESWLATLALDRRLARIVGDASEAMLAQMRLAWWRETLARKPDEWPEGEPILAALASAGADRHALSAMIDGWEILTGDTLDAAAIASAAQDRARGIAAIAPDPQDARPAAYRWALADFGLHFSAPEERERAAGLLAAAPAGTRLTAAMRPLSVLRAMTERAFAAGRPIGGIGDYLRAIRAGLVGT